MDNINDNPIVSQGFNEVPPTNDYSVNLDALLDETQEQVGEANGILQEIEIDERFAGLDPQEAKYRTYQSRYDKILADYNKLQSQFTSVEEKARLIDEMIQNPDMLVAFVNEVNPNLVKKPDSSLYVKERIKEEFGEGYKPTLTRDQSEIEDPGGKDWRYYKRLDQLFAEQNKSVNKATTVKEYKEQLARMEEQKRLQSQAELEQVKKSYNMPDEEVEAMTKFWNNMNLDQAVKLYRFLKRQPQTRANLNMVSGSPNSGMSPEFIEFQKQFKRR